LKPIRDLEITNDRFDFHRIHTVRKKSPHEARKKKAILCIITSVIGERHLYHLDSSGNLVASSLCGSADWIGLSAPISPSAIADRSGQPSCGPGWCV
jgi:hypothetical protein